MTTAGQAKSTRKSTESPLSILIRVILIVFFDAGAVWFIQNALALGFTQLAVVIGVITLMFNLIFLLPKAYPFRWMALGLGFMILLTIYPMVFTLYIAFTNYGDGHLLTREQAIPLIEKQKYLAEDGATYSWTAYKSTDGRHPLCFWRLGSVLALLSRRQPFHGNAMVGAHHPARASCRKIPDRSVRRCKIAATRRGRGPAFRAGDAGARSLQGPVLNMRKLLNAWAIEA